MKRNIIISLLLFTLIIVISCSTQYQSHGRMGGYSETRISENVWKVDIKSNDFAEGERASDYLLLRCAEITNDNGFNYFQISDSASNPSIILSKSDDDWFTKVKTKKSCFITCFKGMPEKGTAYNAKFIIESIKDKYNMP